MLNLFAAQEDRFFFYKISLLIKYHIVATYKSDPMQLSPTSNATFAHIQCNFRPYPFIITLSLLDRRYL